MPDDRSVLSRSAAAPDETISYGPESDHLADVRFGGERASSRPLVMIIHGGFWRPSIDRSHTGPMSEALAAAGWTVASIEYRRIPQHPDHTIQDIQRALQTLPTRVLKHDGRVLVMGHSAGGHLALWAASRRPVPALVGALALGPAADLQMANEMSLGDGAALAFLGEPPQSRADIDPRRMPSPAIATTIVHGDEDDVVPVAVGQSYASAHPQVRFVRLPGVGHFAVIDPLAPAWATVTSELSVLIA